jgi:hypothetical protein
MSFEIIIKNNFKNVYRFFHKFIFFPTSSKKLAPNVPAVCDGLAARIRKCGAFPGPTNCAGATAWDCSLAK